MTDQKDISMTIKNIELVSENIIIYYRKYWYQEDIPFLIEQLLYIADTFETKENIIGADRESFRVSWQNKAQFVINFDYYSQSCWIESTDESSKELLNRVYEQLDQSLLLEANS